MDLFDEGEVTTADQIQRPEDPYRDFNERNPLAGGGMLVQPSADGSRPGYAKDYAKEEALTPSQKKKITEAFPDTKFNFDRYRYGVKKYPDLRNQNIVNKDYTKVLRFINKGYTLGKGEGLTTRGEEPKIKKLSLKDQELIKAQFELPPGEEWDFKTHKYGIKQLGRENLLARMARRLKDKRPWKVAADRGSTKGWMLLQMNRVFENEKKKKIKNLTYEPVYKEINNVKRIIGFKDNTAAGGGNYYYGLDKYAKKNATDITQHGDFKLNQKLVDISKRSFNQPNEVITGLLKQKGFTDKVRLNDLIQYLSGTPGNSKDALLNAITRHHQSGVKFGSATDDLALTTRTINNTIKGIESRIANNIIKPEDIEVLKNNKVFVRSPGGKLYGAGAKTPIGQFKQIEKGVETAIRSSDFNVKGLSAFMKDLGIKCNLAKGVNCNNAKAYQNSLNNLTQKAAQGDEAAKAILSKFNNKVATAGKFIKGALGPLALATEVAVELAIPLNTTLQEGIPYKQAFADTLINKYILGPKLQVDKEAEIAKEMAKGEEFAMAERGRRMFLPEGAPREGQLSVPEERRLKNRMQQMEQAFPTTSEQEIDEILKTQGMTIQDFGMTYPQIQDFIKQDQQMQAIADAGGVANLASGGRAGLSGGDTSGAMLESMNPDSQGLQGLMKRVRNL